MPKFNLYWTERVDNAYHTLQPIEAKDKDEAWTIFWERQGEAGYDYTIGDWDVVDLFDMDAEEVG